MKKKSAIEPLEDEVVISDLEADEPVAAHHAEKYRSPAAALGPWEYTDEGAAVLRQIMGPANPIGKATDHGARVARGDASVIRRRQKKRVK